MNEKEKFGCKKNNLRISFSKDFKRKALIELAKGKSSQEIITQATFDILEINTIDKKYYSKLMHKWRKDLYANNALISFLSVKPTNENLNIEINNIGFDDEIDDIEKEFIQKSD